MDKWILVQFTHILNAFVVLCRSSVIMRVSIRELIYRVVSYAVVASEAAQDGAMVLGVLHLPENTISSTEDSPLQTGLG